jgi:energy-coupling factor transport system substrate-specific component
MTAVSIGPRAAWALAIVSAIGVVAFTWPLFAPAGSAVVIHADEAPWLFAIIVPALLAVALATLADGALDAKAVAIIGVLAAVVCALRPLGGGTAGLEPIWIILILGGRVLGPGCGFLLGAVSLFASGFLTGGVGPWLPYQMLGAGWVAMFAGMLPRATGRLEIALLAGYGALASLAYGLLLNLWFWPFTTSLPAAIAYQPGADPITNLLGWIRFSLLTSLGYDIPRAILTVILILIAGRGVLAALQRVTRRASFGAPVTFAPAVEPSSTTVASPAPAPIPTKVDQS